MAYSIDTPLTVEQVGVFEASYVPSGNDFGRLDKRFRLNRDLLNQLPQYETFGFAVFQLRAGEHNKHPMAFWFSTLEPDSLFFPNVHVHHGKLRRFASFDHILYGQGSVQKQRGLKCAENGFHEYHKSRIDKKTSRIVLGDEGLFKRKIRGFCRNCDIRIKLV